MRIAVSGTLEMMVLADVLLRKGDVSYDNRLLSNLRADCSLVCLETTRFKFCSISCGAAFYKGGTSDHL